MDPRQAESVVLSFLVMCFKICGAHLHFNDMQAYCLCKELYVFSQSLASSERSSEAGLMHEIPEADVGQKSRACCIAAVVPAPRSPSAGGGWPLAQVLLSAAGPVRLTPHLKLSVFWPGSALRAVGLGEAL